MGLTRWWVVAVFVVVMAGCTCGQEPAPDAGVPEVVAWPGGARLVIAKTTAISADIEWPGATGPVTGYRIEERGTARETVVPSTAMVDLRSGEHVTVSVIAVGADGTTTEPLRAEVAPAEPLLVTDGDISTDFCGANAFLIRGAPIPCDEFAVITGHVRTADGVGVPGLRVSVLKHPEWGSTTTQADGLYALAVATGRHTVDLRARAFLPLQRQVTAPPHFFTVVPDTVVLRRDERVTSISLAAGGFHRAAPREDADGQRTTAVFIPPGTSAALKLRDGGTQPTDTLSLRATEATVGATGPEQMPASLPAATAYTFAADVTADEALAIGATGVTFGSPVAMYAENFLGYPVGAAVPLGVYDDTTGRWESGPNAAVVTVTEGGGVDFSGDGAADPNFPLLPGEKEALAAHYAVGTQLVRSVTTHFSAFDTNPCWVCIGSCEENGSSRAGDEPQCDTCPGSVLRMQNQTLSEFFPVSGTGLNLGWHSNRFNVRSAGVDLALGLLADGGQPEGVIATFFRLDVAGKSIVVEKLDGGVGDALRLAWDGKDLFGRTVKGPVPARASTGYGFGAMSLSATSGGGGGGATGVVNLGTPSFGMWPPPGALQMASNREAAFFLKHFSHSLGDWVPRENLGNLTLDVIHGYSEDGTLHLGNGGIVTAAEGGALLKYVAGGGTDTSEDGGWSTVSLSASPVFAEGPEGLYFIERETRVRLLRNDGGVVTVAGDATLGFAGDGLPARQGRFNYARLLEVDAQGNLFVGDIENYRIRRIDAATGVLSTYVGNGQRGSSPDGTFATEAQLDGLADIRFAQDGHLYFMASNGQAGNLLRRVENGRVFTVAGGNCMASRPPWEGRNPREVCFRGAPHWLAEDREGRLYVAGLGSGEGTSTQVLRRIEADGRVTLLAGAGGSTNPEEPVARRTCFSGMTGLAVADDGTAYVGESGGTGCGLRGPGLRAISPEGDFMPFLGGVRAAVAGAKPPDGIAAATQLNGIGDVTRRRDGRLLFLHRGPTTTLHEVVLPGPRVRRLVPSRDGNEVYSFDARGRHLKTTSARTGVTLWEFSWGEHGLQSLRDVNGDVTTVERDSGGRATALLARDGQRTKLTLDVAGRVTRLTDSEERFVEAAYKEGTGLLSEWRDENGNPTRFEWDEAGNLVAHINALGARKTWERLGNDVIFRSPLGKQTTFGRQALTDGSRLTTTLPDGTTATREYSGASRRSVSPDGTTTAVRTQASARFGRAVDVPGDVTVRTPSGLESRLIATRTTTTAPDDPLRVTEEVEELRINGRLWRSRFDSTASLYELVSPMSRRVSITLDEKRRPLVVTAPGVLPVTYSYDARGRVTSVTQGARTSTFTYAANGTLASAEDALQHETQFAADSTGRVSTMTQPDAKTAAFEHDTVGNLTSLTPAERSRHQFTYSKVNEVTSYAAPPLPGVSPETTTYDLDGRANESGHSDGSATRFTRDEQGRTTVVTTPWWTNTLSYLPATGQLASMARGANRLEYEYDGFLMVQERATGTSAATSRWTYDADFRVAAHSVDGVVVASTYDTDGQLTQRGPVTLTHSPTTGQLATVTVGVVATTYTWNEYGEVSGLSTTANGVPVYSEVIRYDAAARIIGVEELIQGTAITWTYGYDAMGRLVSASRNGAQPSTWTYDGSGNRVTESGVSVRHDAQDKLLSRGAITYEWDALRNRSGVNEAGITTRYIHDGLGALLSVTTPAAVVSYEYDARQRRVARRLNGALTDRWVYEGQYRVAASVDAAGVASRFIYASHPHSPDAFLRAGSTFVYVKNHLGTARLVLSGVDGAAQRVFETDPWGAPLTDTSLGLQPFGYAGGLMDRATGLTHFGFRDYDPPTGTWSAVDPIQWGAGNDLSPEPLLQSPEYLRLMAQRRRGAATYAYGSNNPLQLVDPSGLWIRSVAASLRPYLQALRSTPSGARGLRNLELSSRPVDFVDSSAGFDENGNRRRGEARANNCGGPIKIVIDTRSFWRDPLQTMGTTGHEVKHGEQFLQFPSGPPTWLENSLESQANEAGVDAAWEFWP